MIVIESRLGRHVLNFIIGGTEEFFCTLHSAFLQIIGETDLHLLFEQLTQIGGIDAGCLCCVLQTDRILVIAVYKFNGMTYSS